MQRKKNAWAGRFLGVGAVVLLLLSLPFSAAGAEYRSVVKDGVNIRSGPDTKDEILWEVFQGFPLEVLERKGDWARTVDFEGDKGWIYSPLLSGKKTVIVKVKLANLRVGPGENYEIAATAKYGVVFQVLEVKGKWVKVEHTDGTTGWIFSQLVWPGHS